MYEIAKSTKSTNKTRNKSRKFQLIPHCKKNNSKSIIYISIYINVAESEIGKLHKEGGGTGGGGGGQSVFEAVSLSACGPGERTLPFAKNQANLAKPIYQAFIIGTNDVIKIDKPMSTANTQCKCYMSP